MKILLADDHAILRQGLISILSKEFPEAEFGEAETAQAALEQVRKSPWDVLILDVTMPGRSGLAVLKEVKECQPRLPVLVLSMHPEDQYGVRVLQAGADGFMTKVRAPVELVQAVKTLLTGAKYVSATLAQKLASRLGANQNLPPHERLSSREFEVLRLIGSGQSIKEIAATLSVSLQTVSTHRTRMLKKMDLSTTSSLIRYSLENNLVD